MRAMLRQELYVETESLSIGFQRLANGLRAPTGIVREAQWLAAIKYGYHGHGKDTGEITLDGRRRARLWRPGETRREGSLAPGTAELQERPANTGVKYGWQRRVLRTEFRGTTHEIRAALI